MPAKSEQVLDQAIAWHLMVPSMNDDQWDEFIAWLEASPQNRAEYDRIAEVDTLVTALHDPAAGSGLNQAAWPGTRRRGPGRVWAFGAVAAVVVALAAWGTRPTQLPVQIEQTAPGTTKQIAFAGGTTIDLNGETKLTLDQSNPREVALQSGEALFAVRHSKQPFVVEAGGFRMMDLGTIFNVQVSPAALELEVREGKVLFDPGGANLTVAAGQKVAVDLARNVVVKSAITSSSNWVAGELAFDNGSLAAVAAAMHRRSGINIRFSDSLSNAPFTGNIKLSGDEQVDAVHLANLIGANYHREGEAWVLTAKRAAR